MRVILFVAEEFDSNFVDLLVYITGHNNIADCQEESQLQYIKVVGKLKTVLLRP